jgi:serine/threonine-protein kinase
MTRLPLENEVLDDKYRIERVVGRGGMGIVLAAWHLALDQRVALKCLQPELAQNPESAARFLREARAAAKIKSEHGVRVLDVGNFDDGLPYMVMEFLEGRDLADELRDRGPLPVEECMNYALQALEAVAEAHSLGIVHRDLKPENLFLARLPDGMRSVKVLDFGISKSMVIGSADNRSLTQSTTIMGSPLYMSPEQMRAPRTVDARTDIWSLGAIIYELLAGHPPYVADTLPQLCAKMLESDPEPLRTLRPDVDPELEAAVTKCLARNVHERWPSMGELAQALFPFASRSARVNVERAGRVLNTTENNARMAPMTLASRNLGGGGSGGTPNPGRGGGTPTKQSARDLEVPLRGQTPVSHPDRSAFGTDPHRVQTPGQRVPTPDQHGIIQGDPILTPQGAPPSPMLTPGHVMTPSGMSVSDTASRGAWENARGRSQTISAHPPHATTRRTSAVFLAVGTGVGLVALGAFFWLTQRADPGRNITPVLSAASETPAAVTQHAPAEPTAVAPAPTPAPLEALAKADAANAAPSEPAPAASAPSAATPHAAAPSPPVVVATPPPMPRRTTSTPPAPNPPAQGKGGLTDFGGRR